jgi:hypothetical protein
VTEVGLTFSEVTKWIRKQRGSLLIPLLINLSPAADEPENEQDEDGTNDGMDDLGENARAKRNAEHGEDPAAKDGTKDADDDLADEAEIDALDEKIRHDASDCADDDPNNNASQVHNSSFGICPMVQGFG